jgi:hypothetical protein
MDAKIILGRILQRLIDEGHAQVPPLNAFGFMVLKRNSVVVSRENGQDTPVPFARLVRAIEILQQHPEIYTHGPDALRPFGITHLNSPIYALLHLLPKEVYEP